MRAGCVARRGRTLDVGREEVRLHDEDEDESSGPPHFLSLRSTVSCVGAGGVAWFCFVSSGGGSMARSHLASIFGLRRVCGSETQRNATQQTQRSSTHARTHARNGARLPRGLGSRGGASRR